MNELHGRIRSGKIVSLTPRYNHLSGGNWIDGFTGVASTGGEEKEYDVINEEMIDKSKPAYTYVFIIEDGKAKIIR